MPYKTSAHSIENFKVQFTQWILKLLKNTNTATQYSGYPTHKPLFTNVKQLQSFSTNHDTCY